MARAKPHKKKSDVINTKGTKYFLSVIFFCSVDIIFNFNLFHHITYLLPMHEILALEDRFCLFIRHSF